MNRFFLAIAVIFFISAEHSFAQDTTKTNQLSQLLDSYYSIKDALVADNTVTASAKAGEFIKFIGSVDMAKMPEADNKAFMSIQKRLVADVTKIASSKNINSQRQAFSSLSNNIYQLAKTVTLSSGPVYQVYCPMKNAYWLSSTSAVKSPYYGSSMLTCGKVSDTINK